jgi:hypothetical protein
VRRRLRPRRPARSRCAPFQGHLRGRTWQWRRHTPRHGRKRDPFGGKVRAPHRRPSRWCRSKRRKWGEARGAATVAVTGSTPAGAVGHPPGSRRYPCGLGELPAAARERGTERGGRGETPPSRRGGRRRRRRGTGRRGRPPSRRHGRGVVTEKVARVSRRPGRRAVLSQRSARMTARSASDGQEDRARSSGWPSGPRTVGREGHRGVRPTVSAAWGG